MREVRRVEAEPESSTISFWSTETGERRERYVSGVVGGLVVMSCR